MKLTEGERNFVELLDDRGIKYIPKPGILWVESGGYIIPDLYLPEYRGYCEIITYNAPNESKRRGVGDAIQAGKKFTFYHSSGKKHYFSPKSLKGFRVNSNDDFFDIEVKPYATLAQVLKYPVPKWEAEIKRRYSKYPDVKLMSKVFEITQVALLAIVEDQIAEMMGGER